MTTPPLACCPALTGVVVKNYNDELKQYDPQKNGDVTIRDCVLPNEDGKCPDKDAKEIDKTFPFSAVKPFCEGSAGEIISSLCGSDLKDWEKVVPVWMWVIVALLGLGTILALILAFTK